MTHHATLSNIRNWSWMIPCNLCWLSTGRTLIVPTFLPPENSSKNKAHQLPVFDGEVRSVFAIMTGALSPAYLPERPKVVYRAALYQQYLKEPLNYCRNRYCKTICRTLRGLDQLLKATIRHFWEPFFFNSLNSSIEDCSIFPFFSIRYPNQNSSIKES